MTDSDRRAAELIAQALSHPWDSDERFAFVSRCYGEVDDDATFRVAAELLHSEEGHARHFGAMLLKELGVYTDPEPDHWPYRDRCVDLLVQRLERESDPMVLAMVGAAFFFLASPRSIPSLLELCEHEDPDVRDGAVFGLHRFSDRRAVTALMRLMDDEDDDVRDWATFGLAALDEVDGPDIRAAFRQRLGDSNDEIRGEALVGLALRGDPGVVTPLLAAIDDGLMETVGGILEEAVVETAARLYDARLRPHLEEYWNGWQACREDDDEPSSELLAAIERYDLGEHH
jgi:HEAT repeat protein